MNIDLDKLVKGKAPLARLDIKDIITKAEAESYKSDNSEDYFYRANHIIAFFSIFSTFVFIGFSWLYYSNGSVMDNKYVLYGAFLSYIFLSIVFYIVACRLIEISVSKYNAVFRNFHDNLLLIYKHRKNSKASQLSVRKNYLEKRINSIARDIEYISYKVDTVRCVRIIVLLACSVLVINLNGNAENLYSIIITLFLISCFWIFKSAVFREQYKIKKLRKIILYYRYAEKCIELELEGDNLPFEGVAVLKFFDAYLKSLGLASVKSNTD